MPAVTKILAVLAMHYSEFPIVLFCFSIVHMLTRHIFCFILLSELYYLATVSYINHENIIMC